VMLAWSKSFLTEVATHNEVAKSPRVWSRQPATICKD
jgi:hypothetical protein